MSQARPFSEHFAGEMARGYDARNAKLAPIADCLHLLTRLVLRRLPTGSRVLSVGAGTGAEILALAAAFPTWSFVALDPSASMLEICRTKLAEAGVLERCELVHGYVEDLPGGESFDAALSFFVAHFVPRDARVAFLRAMIDRLQSGGELVTAEISCDLDSEIFPAVLDDWKGLQLMMGATPESLDKLDTVLRDVLAVLSPAETERLWRESGIDSPVRFFQAHSVYGWHGTKR